MEGESERAELNLHFNAHFFIGQVNTGRSVLPIGSHGLGNLVSVLRSYSDGFVSASCDSIIVWRVKCKN